MMIGRMRRMKINPDLPRGETPVLVPSDDGTLLQMDTAEPFEVMEGEDIEDAVRRHADKIPMIKKVRKKVDFNDAMLYLIGYTLQEALGNLPIVEGSDLDRKGEVLFNSIKKRAKRFPDEDHRNQFVVSMERCLEILKGVNV